MAHKKVTRQQNEMTVHFWFVDCKFFNYKTQCGWGWLKLLTSSENGLSLPNKYSCLMFPIWINRYYRINTSSCQACLKKEKCMC